VRIQEAATASARSPAARFKRPDWTAWKRFLSAIAALGTGFLLAIYSNIFAEQGRLGATALCASLALLLSVYVAFTAVPYLARRASKEWLRVTVDYRLTREGIIFIAIVFILAIAGLNTGNNLLYLVVASLLAAILISGVLSLAVLSGLSVEVLLPEHVFARRKVPARIRVDNQKRLLPSFSITLSGGSDEAEQAVRKKRVKAAPVERARILDRALYFPFLPAARTLSRHIELEYPRRGLYSEKNFRLSTRFPFGFLEKTLEIPLRRELCVYPAVEPTDEFYEILPMLSGELEAFQRGRGHDLYSIRDLLTTDSARHVDWKASARTGNLKIREFTREDERRLQVVFDRRLAATDPDAIQRFEAAVELCACLVWHFHEIDAQLQFVCGDYQTSLSRSGEIAYDVLRFLAAVQPVSEMPLEPPRPVGNESIFRIVLTDAPRGSAATAAWSGSYFIFFDGLRSGMRTIAPVTRRPATITAGGEKP
jgi:uncharacterized protein (DUF58 family)